jgi:hypothetical protein
VLAKSLDGFRGSGQRTASRWANHHRQEQRSDDKPEGKHNNRNRDIFSAGGGTN